MSFRLAHFAGPLTVAWERHATLSAERLRLACVNARNYTPENSVAASRMGNLMHWSFETACEDDTARTGEPLPYAGPPVPRLTKERIIFGSARVNFEQGWPK